MSSNPNDWLEVAGKIWKESLGLGIVIGATAAAVWATFAFGFFEKDMMSGWPYNVARLVTVICGALAALGLIVWAFRLILLLLRLPFRAIANFRQSRAESARILENVMMLPAPGRLMIYAFMLQQNGRFAHPPESRLFDRLVTLDLVSSDDGRLALLYPGRQMKVHPALLKDKVVQQVKEIVVKDYPEASSVKGLQSACEVAFQNLI